MKIVLPRTLAEPWAIPWSTQPKNAALIMHIKNSLRDYFAYLEKEGITPGKQKRKSSVSISAISSALRNSARNNGAKEVRSELWHLPNNVDLTTKVGYQYLVRFTVPGNDGIHTITLNSYFK